MSRMVPVRLQLAVAGALVVLLLGASSASGADKPYSLVISNADGSTPATLAAGSEGTVRATYRNLTGQQQLGSSDLVVPGALRIVSASVAPGGTASISGNTIRLRNLSIAPSGSGVVTIRVATDCTAQALTWQVPVTKQANNFSGPPGNNLNLEPALSELGTVVTGACALRFLAQPRNARVSQTITNVAYDPSGAPVAVEVVDGAGQRIPTSSLAVTVGLGANPGNGTLAGTTTVTTSNGVASFVSLSINQPGVGYTLVATSPQTSSATSDSFNIDEVAVLCQEDVDCTGSIPLRATNQSLGGSSTVDVTAIEGPLADTDTGFLTVSRQIGGPLDCVNYTELTAVLDVVAVDFTALDREKRVVATIDKRVMNASANNGASFLDTCFGAPYQFATKPGTPLEVNATYVPGPYPAPEYKGLLPDCGGTAVLDDPTTPGVSGPAVSSAGPPCVVKRKKNQAGDGIIESLWPSGRTVGAGDPRGRS